jgi:DNA topoisomerase-1
MIAAIDEARKVYEKIIERYGEVGDGLTAVVGMLKESRRTIGACPRCGSGRLVIIYSRKTGKRFIGCSSYSSGCRFSLPLPQRGRITPSQGKCKVCGFPIIEVRGLSRKVWRLCVNVDCESKKKECEYMPDLREPK